MRCISVKNMPKKGPKKYAGKYAICGKKRTIGVGCIGVISNVPNVNPILDEHSDISHCWGGNKHGDCSTSMLGYNVRWKPTDITVGNLTLYVKTRTAKKLSRCKTHEKAIIGYDD